MSTSIIINVFSLSKTTRRRHRCNMIIITMKIQFIENHVWVFSLTQQSGVCPCNLRIKGEVGKCQVLYKGDVPMNCNDDFTVIEIKGI